MIDDWTVKIDEYDNGYVMIIHQRINDVERRYVYEKQPHENEMFSEHLAFQELVKDLKETLSIFDSKHEKVWGRYVIDYDGTEFQ